MDLRLYKQPGNLHVWAYSSDSQLHNLLRIQIIAQEGALSLQTQACQAKHAAKAIWHVNYSEERDRQI